MKINGVESDGIDFHFELYARNDIFVPPKLLSKLMWGAPVSAPLENGQWLNVSHVKQQGTTTPNLGLYQGAIAQRETRPDLGGPAVSLGTIENLVQIESEPLPDAIQLPREWFKIAKLVLGHQNVKPSGESAPKKQTIVKLDEPIRLQPAPR